jgi:phenylpropionate dioxygenase-like ring-hydroxylating dioxygenase large terminal subunit
MLLKRTSRSPIGDEMSDATQFPNIPYGAYLRREIPSANLELTQVGPGTPCGEYFRRFWQPVAFSHELKDLPVRIRILGEDLVVFRDRAGRVGLLQLHCSHRGVSLEYGLVSQRGIRCCYHGWLYDIDGRILETPGEPASSTLKDELCHGAYPVQECNGIVFAYMGPPGAIAPFPAYDTLNHANYFLAKFVIPCNWLQILDNGMDPVHAVFLHTRSSQVQFSDAYGLLGVFEWQESPLGMIYIASRRIGSNIWVRINDLILPNIIQVPPNWEDGTQEKLNDRPGATIWSVPIDDTHTMNVNMRQPEAGQGEMTWEAAAKSAFGELPDRPYEERQRVPADVDVFTGQRPTAIHALEHLGSTDLGVVKYRRLVRQGIEAVKAKRDPKGIIRDATDAIPTYCQNTVLKVPKAANEEAEEALLRQTGRRVAEGYYLARTPRHEAASPETTD